MRWKSLGFAMLILLIVFARPMVARAQGDVPRFEPSACPSAIPLDKKIECGYLVVLEDRARPDGPTIRLAVAIVKSHSPTPAHDPLVYLSGGPGTRTLQFLPALLPQFDLFLATRDVIFFDQRGVGFSQPALECPELNGAAHLVVSSDLSHEALSALMAEAIRQCRDRLTSQGVNLSAYTSAQSAADLNDLRLALGYQAWNLYGISYGTRLALTAMRDHPEGLRSVILDSVAPPQVNLYLDATANADRAFNVLFEGCAADVVCNSLYPNLRTVFYDLAEHLDRQPVTVQVKHPVTGGSFDVPLTRYALVSAMFDALYSAQSIKLLPGAIYDARDGDYTPLADLVAQSASVTDLFSLGMSLSVECNEEAPFASLDEVRAAKAIYPNALRAATSPYWFVSEIGFSLCQEWGAASPAPIENEPVHSDIPTLVLAGEYDPVTPPAWGKQTAAHLSRSFFYEFPAIGHGVVQGGLCPTSIMTAFVRDPATAPDVSCITRMDAAPKFLVRARVLRLPVWIVLPLLGMVALWSLTFSGLAALKHPALFTTRHSLRIVGWIPVAASGGLVALAFLLRDSYLMLLELARAVEILLPPLAALQAAFLFSPEDEPALEVTMAAPRSLAWTLLERLAVLLVLQGSLALIASLFAASWTGESLVQTVVRWLPPLLFFSGLAICLTLITRRAILGVVILSLLWFAFSLLGDAMVARWPFTWPLNVYLQPDHAEYALNRLFVALLGVNLIVLAATRLLHDEERLLLDDRKMKKARNKTPDPNAQTASAQDDASFVMPRKHPLLFLFQIAAMIRYEFLLQLRRPGLLAVVGGMIGLPLLSFLVNRSQFAELSAAVAAGGLSFENARAIITNEAVFRSWLTAWGVCMMLLPIVVADTLPKDRHFGVRELLESLPLTPGTYLAGKVLSVWVSLLGGVGLAALIGSAIWWSLAGPFTPGIYFEMWFVGVASMALVNSGLALLLAAGQPTNRRAILVGVAFAILSLAFFGPGMILHGTNWNLLNPSHPELGMYYMFGWPGAGAGDPLSLRATALASRSAALRDIAAGAAEVAVAWVVVWIWLRRRESGA